ncbi:phage portal protein [Xenophilus sp.]|uniref:phage portal protein n=1 Tax=Xenophilus sp. TaxID=1873499 RepID=UPI0037DCBFF5
MKLWPFSRKSNEDGSIRHSLDLFRLLYGWMATKSGASVSHKSALEVSVVLACARVISEGIAQVPFKLYRADGEKMAPATDHPLYSILHRRPNSWMTSFDLRETMALHAVLTGDAVSFVNRVRGEVREIIPFAPANVTIKQENDYRLTYRLQAPNGQSQDFPQEAIWHWRGPSWDGVCGMDVVKLARESIGLAMATEESQARMTKSGASMSGLYSVEDKLNPDQYKALREWIDKNFDGPQNVGRTKLLDRGAKYTPTSMTAVDAQLLETRKQQVEEICRAFRVMPIMVGYSDKTATYASAESMFLAHVVHTLAPWYTRIEQSGECQLLTEREREQGYFIKFNAAGLMRGSHKDRAEYYAKALGAGGAPGWMTQDEIRALEELNPMGGEAAVLPKPTNVAGDKPKEGDDGESDLQPA